MERKLNILLFIVVLICLYIILQVNLNIFFFIGYSPKANQINQILVNLSYSFVAAYMFYLLTVAFPHYIRKRTLRRVIIHNLQNLYRILKKWENESISLGISIIDLKEIDQSKKITIDTILENLNDKDFNEYLRIIITLMNEKYKPQIHSRVDEALKHKEGLTNTEIFILERFKNCELFYDNNSEKKTPDVGGYLIRIYEERMKDLASIDKRIH